ncbi:Uncharacterised protein [uncultured archaeon]|nr:Uncharacterised protein [uncultured archaeon]
MISEILVNLLDLNPGYFLDLATGGIFWVFALAAAAHYFGNGKNLLLNFIIITGLVLSMQDLLKAQGLALYTAQGLFVLFFARQIVLTVLEHSGWSKQLPLAFAITTWAVVFFYNFFMV